MAPHRRPASPERHARPDRLEPGTWAVFNGRGEALARGFDSEEEALEWIKERSRP